MRGAVAIAAVLALVACDNTPNPDFKDEVEAQKAAQAGDLYATLETSLPLQRLYSRQSDEARQEFANSKSGEFRSTFDGRLGKLDEDEEIDRGSALFRACRAAFAAASDWQKNAGTDAATDASERSSILGELKSCRASAKQAGDDDGALLARFASGAIAMIGAKAVGQGDTAAGLKIWAEGEAFSREDRPGFELNARAFRGY